MCTYDRLLKTTIMIEEKKRRMNKDDDQDQRHHWNPLEELSVLTGDNQNGDICPRHQDLGPAKKHLSLFKCVLQLFVFVYWKLNIIMG